MRDRLTLDSGSARAVTTVYLGDCKFLLACVSPGATEFAAPMDTVAPLGEKNRTLWADFQWLVLEKKSRSFYRGHHGSHPNAFWIHL
jgi:hypothetical protein